MSTNINNNMLLNFIKRTVGAEKLDIHKAQQLGIDAKDFEEADENDSNFIEITDEVLDNDKLYEKFASMLIDEQENDKAADEEKEKEEANKVQAKGESKGS